MSRSGPPRRMEDELDDQFVEARELCDESSFISTGSESYKSAISDDELVNQFEMLAMGRSPGGTTVASPGHSNSSSGSSYRSACSGPPATPILPEAVLMPGTGMQQVMCPGLHVGRLVHGVRHDKLSYLEHTAMVEMRPGLDADGAILFVLTSRESVTHCKKAGTSLFITDFDDGSPKFSMSGAPQLPFTVDSSNGSLGSVNQFDSYAYDLDITYNIGNIPGWAIARYDVKQRGNDIGEIYILSGQMSLTFQVHAPAEIKALMIAYGINRALSVHRENVVDSKQPQQAYNHSFHMLYENVFPLMESCILRAVSKAQNVNNFVQLLMDANNQNRVLLILRYDEDNDRVEAVDVRNNELFVVDGLIKIKGGMKVSHRNLLIGKGNPGKAKGMHEMRTTGLPGILVRCLPPTAAAANDFTFLDESGNVICVVTKKSGADQSPITIKIFILKGLQTNVKKLILAHAIKIAYYTQNHVTKLPTVFLSKPNTTTTSNPALRYSPLPLPAPQKPLANVSNYVVRAAGCHIPSATEYYNVMNSGNGDVLVTLECKQEMQAKGGSNLVARDNEGAILYTVPDILGQGTLAMYLPDGNLAGYHTSSTFYDSAGAKLMEIADGKQYQSYHADSWGPDFAYYFKKGVVCVALLMRKNCTLELQIFDKAQHPVSDLERCLMISTALRLLYHIYRFHMLPVPQVDYHYAGTSAATPRVA